MKTIFSDIQFNKQYHTYTYRGRRLTSVTKVIGQLKPPFDREGNATRVARREGKTVETVLAEWDAKGQAGREKGRQVHEYIDGVLSSHVANSQVAGGQAADDQAPVADAFLALNRKLPEMAAFDALWENLSPVVDVMQHEWIIGDAEMGVAGLPDCLAEAAGLTSQGVASRGDGQRAITPATVVDALSAALRLGFGLAGGVVLVEMAGQRVELWPAAYARELEERVVN